MVPANSAKPEVFAASQAAHVEEDWAPPAEEYVPLSQLAHVDDDVAPKDDENFPARQDSHDAEPDAVEYLTALHDSHSSS